MVTQIVEINPLEIAATPARDAQPDETIPQLTRGASVVRRKSTASRMKIIREGWQHWVALNANDLTWTALIIGGVLFTNWLTRGWPPAKSRATSVVRPSATPFYRRPVYLSHSLANAVRLLRKSSQSSGISNLIFSRGSPPGGGAAPCLAE